MNETILNGQFNEYFSRYGYIGIYLFFITVDQIAPIPEEISLIVIGTLAAHGLINPLGAAVFAIAGFLTIDVIYFYLTVSGSKLVSKMSKRTGSATLSGYKQKLKEHMFKTIFILSFIPRVRLLTPVMVALAELRFPKFIVYSSISLGIFSAIYIAIGYIFSKNIASLLAQTSDLTHYLFLGFMALFTIVVSVIVYRKFR